MAYKFEKYDNLYPAPNIVKINPDPDKLSRKPDDYRTPWGDGTRFYDISGKEYATPGQAQRATKEYFESQDTPFIKKCR